jgi:hypothetical protein
MRPLTDKEKQQRAEVDKRLAGRTLPPWCQCVWGIECHADNQANRRCKRLEYRP